jgi:hypothetical protein
MAKVFTTEPQAKVVIYNDGTIVMNGEERPNAAHCFSPRMPNDFGNISTIKQAKAGHFLLIYEMKESTPCFVAMIKNISPLPN